VTYITTEQLDRLFFSAQYPRNIPRLAAPFRVLRGLELVQQHEYSSFGRYVERIFGTVEYNPSDPNSGLAIQETYETECQVEDLYAERLPTKKGFQQLHHQILDDRCSCIVLLGRRGSGKTFAINYFLSSYFHQLNEGYSITFFRCDVARLAALNDPPCPDSAPITIQEYIAAHMYFVLFRWGTNDNLLKYAFPIENRIESKQTFAEYLAKSIADKQKQAVLHEIWRTLCAKYEECCQTLSLKQIKLSFIGEVVRDIDRPQPKDYRLLFRHFLMYIRNLGSTENIHRGKVINIIDGVDNLLHRPDTDTLRLDYLRQLIPYLPHNTEAATFDKNIIIMRDESWHELNAYTRSLFKPDPENYLSMLHMGRASLDNIFARKRRVAMQPVSAKFKEWLKGDVEKAINDNMTTFDLVSKTLLTQMSRVEEFLPIRNKDNSWNPIDCLFNGNIRSYSRNLVRSYDYLIAVSRRNKRIGEELQKSIQEGRVDSVTAIEKILLEGSITAGNAFMSKNTDRQIKGRWCPNLFFFDQVDGYSHWGGLTTLRLLQLVGHQGQKYSAQSAAALLSELFGYPKDIVRNHISDAREFGLVENDGYMVQLNCINAISGFAPALKLTQKAEYTKLLAFSNAAVFYLMALGTPMSDPLLRILPSEPLVHHHQVEIGRRSFPIAAVSTSILLMYHIAGTHRSEMEKLHNRQVKPEFAHEELVFRNAKSIFSLPNWDKLTGELHEHAGRFPNPVASDVVELFKRLEKIIVK
jgi:hypothetical protein